MSSNSTVSITFKMEDSTKGFKQLSMGANGLRDVMKMAAQEAKDLQSSFIKSAAAAATYNSLNDVIQQAAGAMKDLCGAYAIQQEAETKLETVMRQRMTASQEDIQSIKDLTSAQQQLGIIGDEVQLAGAQQIATFLNTKSALAILIPAMNNLLAQQKGYAATGMDAAAVGNMIGKVMQGQTSALKRVGITFDEAQEKTLKYGTESQRAAALASIITQNVGEMNAALAKTDAGKQKQLENALGDVKEKIGSVISGIQPYITLVATTTTAVTGILKFGTAMKAVSVAIAGFTGKLKLASVASWLLGTNAKSSIVGLTMLGTTSRGAAIGINILKISLRGLLLATGIGLVIAGVSWAIEALTGAADSASDSVDGLAGAEARAKKSAEDMKAAQEAANQQVLEAKSALELNIAKCKDFQGTKEEERKIVEQLNGTYGETMGYFASVSDWYNALIANSKTYCRQLELEAQMRLIANQLAETDDAIRKVRYNDDGSLKRYSTQPNKRFNRTTSMWEIQAGTSDWDKANKLLTGAGGLYAQRRNQRRLLEQKSRELNSVRYSVKGASAPSVGRSGGGGVHRPSRHAASAASIPRNSAADFEKEKTRLEKIDEEVKKLQADYLKLGDTEPDKKKKAAVEDQIQALQDEATQLELTLAAASTPKKLDSLKDFDAYLNYLNELEKVSTKGNLPTIQAKRKDVEAQKRAFEDASIEARAFVHGARAFAHEAGAVSMPLADIESELSDVKRLIESTDSVVKRQVLLSYYKDLKKTAEDLNDEFDDLYKAETDLSKISSKRGLEAAASYWGNRAQRFSGEEYADNMRRRQEAEGKLKTFADIDSVFEMQTELDDIQKLTGKDYTLKVKSMGIEELTEKIKTLDRLMADGALPKTVRDQAEKIRDAYAGMRAESLKSFDTIAGGWSSVKSVGDGISSLTSAIENNGNAWEKFTGIIDAAISIFQGIMAITGFFTTLKEILNTGAAANHANADASAVNTVATAAQAAAIGIAAPVITAGNEAMAKSFINLAAAEMFAAHSYIPFAGVGIAEGQVATMIGTLGAVKALEFAKGGIAYGPTFGLFGEYAGASTNPEVVAPLDKLRSMIEPAGAVYVAGQFRVRGSDLVSVIANESRIASRSGKRTNIKI